MEVEHAVTHGCIVGLLVILGDVYQRRILNREILDCSDSTLK